MTTWRISALDRDRRSHDLVIESTEGATVGQLSDELHGLGFQHGDLTVDGITTAADQVLADSPLQHGSRVYAREPMVVSEPGWYIVTVAGPDTGAFASIAKEGISIGRSPDNGLTVKDAALSARHFVIKIDEGRLVVEDLGSSNGTFLEGKMLDQETSAAAGNFIAAGSTTFGLVKVDSSELVALSLESGATTPWPRRFRDALPPMPERLKHPTRPSERSTLSGRSRLSIVVQMIAPILMLAASVVYILVISSSNDSASWSNFLMPAMMTLFGLIQIPTAVDAWRRHRSEHRHRERAESDYEESRQQFLSKLTEAREEERRRDRWAATPAGVAALLTRLRHSRLWERGASDEDFCEVAIGLHSRRSAVGVENRLDDEELPLDLQRYAVLRHSLLAEGSLAILGSMQRGRALARSILLDLATSHSPNDLKLWLISDDDAGASAEWNGVRWLPHNFMDDSSNRVFSTPSTRAAAFSLLRSIVNERASGERRSGVTLPAHAVVIDCVDRIETEELTDLLVDGAAVGVVGIVVDEIVTPEGTQAQVEFGVFADETAFVSKSQPQADEVRSFEMMANSFESAARAMAALRPAGSGHEVQGGSELIRLVDLIEAEVDASGVSRVVQRWSEGATSRIRVGGLGDLITEIDIMRDGPHGLVGGTTRSGKTEFLKSLFTSLAVANHPNDLSIVIVDFKGGVDHELSAMLPQVIDLSTNHNVDSFLRTVRLIEAEMERRQREFKKVGAPNFDAYRAARESDATLPPVPRLLVVIDEFSELLNSETGKANLASLESVTRVGGGLGVHLLLVTQNFENQLPSQIAANAGLRICFRVQEAAHSKAVLNSPEAASIPKERIGRAFLRSHGGRVVEFQAARIAGPRPGKEMATSPVKARIVPFSTLSETPPSDPIVDVPAEDTDMYSVVQVVRNAAARTGWTRPVVPWPKELPRNLGLSASAGADMVWTLGLLDEPERQRQTPIGLAPYGPHMLFVGGAGARLGEVLRAVVVAGAIKRGPEELHFYVIDTLGQGLSALQALPHVGGVAERNEPLAMRIVRHVAAEVAERKSRMSEFGMANVQELRSVVGELPSDVVLVVHGADRLLMHGESEPSPVLAPLLSLLAESVGTGVRILLSGPPAVALHRLGTSVGQRFVFECPDPQDYAALGVSRELYSGLDGLGRAIDMGSDRLMQFALVPSTGEAPAPDVVRAIGQRLSERWHESEGSPRRPVPVSELPWPLPIRHVTGSKPPPGVQQPVALSVETDTGEVSWLDTSEDGPVFVVCGSPKSGRSNALIVAATLMAEQGWHVLGLPLSRRSPIADGAFPGAVVSVGDLCADADTTRPVALFVDDAHKWTEEVDGLRALLDGPGRRAVVVAGPTESFSERNDLMRTLGSMRCALVLAPRGSLDASQFGVRRLSNEVIRDARPGRGVLVVAGELSGAQVPLALSAELTRTTTIGSVL